MNKDPDLSSPPPLVWWPAMVYFMLIVVGIPWYWPTDNHTIIFGMPGWVIVAIGASLVCSIFTAWLLWSPWPSESNRSDKGAQDRSSDVT